MSLHETKHEISSPKYTLCKVVGPVALEGFSQVWLLPSLGWDWPRGSREVHNNDILRTIFDQNSSLGSGELKTK